MPILEGTGGKAPSRYPQRSQASVDAIRKRLGYKPQAQASSKGLYGEGRRTGAPDQFDYSLKPSQRLPLGNVAQNLNPWGGVPTGPGGSSGGGRGGRGGGGGGGGGGGTTQAMLDAIAAMFGRTKPKGLPAWNAPKFYAFNTTPYTTAKAGLRNAIRDDRNIGMGAYADAATELDQYVNPFANLDGRVAVTPQISGAMRRMMDAQGVGTGVADQMDTEGLAQDGGLAATLAMLAGASQEAQGSRQRALQGDTRRFNEMLDSEQRTLTSQIDMALARARSDYEKDKFAYGVDVAKKNYDTKLADIMQQNQWRQSLSDPIMQLIMGSPGLDYSKLQGVF